MTDGRLIYLRDGHTDRGGRVLVHGGVRWPQKGRTHGVNSSIFVFALTHALTMGTICVIHCTFSKELKMPLWPPLVYIYFRTMNHILFCTDFGKTSAPM